MKLKSLLITLAFVLLAAHFLRYGQLWQSVVILLLPLILLVKSPLPARLLQAGLLLGVVAVWAPTTWQLVELRMAAGQPWLRLMVIMYGVMLYNLVCLVLAGDIAKARQQR